MMTTQLMTKRETAKVLRTSERTLDKLRAEGVGPAVTRIRGKVLFRADDLDAWVKSRTDPAPKT